MEKKYDARFKIVFDTIFAQIYSGEYFLLESKKKNNSQKKIYPARPVEPGSPREIYICNSEAYFTGGSFRVFNRG